MESRPITNNGSEIYFCRHAQSLQNIGKEILDSPLTDKGVNQAKQLTGNFDIVISSPLRRCLETLHYSDLDYQKLIICPELRERIQNIGSLLPLEQADNLIQESNTHFWNRVNSFHQQLESLCVKEKSESENPLKILIIGHAYFFNAWYRGGCFPAPNNAEIMRLI